MKKLILLTFVLALELTSCSDSTNQKNTKLVHKTKWIDKTLCNENTKNFASKTSSNTLPLSQASLAQRDIQIAQANTTHEQYSKSAQYSNNSPGQFSQTSTTISSSFKVEPSQQLASSESAYTTFNGYYYDGNDWGGGDNCGYDSSCCSYCCPPTTCCTWAPSCDPCCPIYPQFVALFPSLEYRGGDGRSYEGGYETVGLFLALYDCEYRSYPFIDLRAHLINEDGGLFAGNFGVGWRTFDPCFGGNMFGLNTYFDYRQFRHGSLKEIGIGLEYFGNWFDFRANGYIPVGNENALRETKVLDYLGGYVARREELFTAMWGLDFEFGTYLWCCPKYNIYAAVGPYFYSTEDSSDAIVGGMGRIAAEFRKWLTLEFDVTYDELFNATYQGEVIVRIPLPCALSCWQCLFRPIRRNDILIGRRHCCFETNF